ncbi:MAG: MRP family ATP-binding protein [Flavobacteriia bacterium]|nr:MRP family ATP-binding protein [Flavobacteriia bacterium]
MTRERILELLSVIPDPETKQDLVSANLIGDLHIEDHKIDLQINSLNPALHARKRMEEAVRFRLEKELGSNIELSIKVSAVSGVERKGRRSVLPEVKNVVAIASGKGGVGKSTLTANLAVGLAQAGYKVGLIDADIYGPSMLEVDGKSLIEPVENHQVKLLSIGFFTDQENAVVWRGPMASKALTQMITEGHWGELDYLLIDLPPGTGDIHLSLLQTLPLDGVVIISTPQEVALADARRGINMFRVDGLNVPIVGIVENMAWFTPEELPNNKYYIFGRDGAKNLANGMGIEFLGAVPLVQSIREAGDVGRPAVLQKGSIIGLAFDELVHNFVRRMQQLKS